MDLLFKVIGGIGLLGIIVGVLVKNEKRQDALFILGGLFLLAYSIYLGDIIFVVLQGFFTGAAVFKLAQLVGQPSLWQRFKHLLHK